MKECKSNLSSLHFNEYHVTICILLFIYIVYIFFIARLVSYKPVVIVIGQPFDDSNLKSEKNQQ